MKSCFSICRLLYVLAFGLWSVVGFGQVIISQYYEGSSNNKWIEITNIGTSSVDLTSPQLHIALFTNADADNPANSNPNSVETLSGIINPGSSILFKNSSAILPNYASGFNSAICNFNGDDLIILTAATGSSAWSNRIDVIGNGTSWGSNTSFLRNATINSPSQSFNIAEWTEVSNSTVDNANIGTSERLGEHIFSIGVDNPSNFSATPVSTSQIDLEYDDNADGNNIIIVFDTDNTFTTPTGMPTVAGSTFAGGEVLYSGNGSGTINHDNLTENTTYYYKTWSYVGSEYSFGIELSASTLCSAITSFPFTEGFESSSNIPDCWTSFRGFNGIGTAEDWQIDTDSNNANSGNNSAYVSFEDVSGGIAQDWLVTPPFDLSGINNPELSFFAIDEFIDDFNTVYSIQISTTSQTNIGSFTTVATYDESVFQNDYSEFIVDLSVYNGQTIFIAFVMEQDDGDSWYLDDISIRESSGNGNLCSNIFSDNFDGSLGQWSSTNDWTISNNELKHDLDNMPGNSYIYADINNQDLTTANYEWEFCIRNGNWDPSNNNKFSYFLISDQFNLSNPGNGYAVGLNMTSSSDLLSLYKIDAGVYTPIVTSSFDWNANDDVCIKVTRSNTGEWLLLYDNGSGEVNGGTIVDNTYTSGQFIGTYFDFTSTRAGELWLDDISICRDDNISANQFIINFDEDDKWVAGSSNISNYAIDHTYTDLNWLFTDGPALRNTVTIQDGFPGALDVYGWRIEDSPDAFWSGIYQGNEVIKTFGFDVRRWDNSSEPDYSIEYSIDGGINFMPTGDIINNSLLNNSSDWFTYEFEIPSIQHHDSDDFIVQLVRSGGGRIMVDNFLYEFALEDTDSEILAPDSQVADGDLIVGEAVDTFDAVSVFAFKLQDSGSGDGLPTIVNSMRFIAGNQNTANFNEVIDEVVIYVDNTRIFNSSTIVSLLENEINIEFDYSQGNASSLLEIGDNTTKNIEVRVSVNQTGMVSGETFQIAIDDNSLGFGVARESSIFSRNILPISGNEFEIRVNATQLNFVQQPQYAKVNNTMPFGVSVSASDAAGNIDRSITGQVELTSTGSLQSSPLTANFVDGIATFNNIIYTATGNDLELTATDVNATLSPTTSLSFDIRNPLELYISEVTDPLNTSGGRYVEIYNHSVDTIDFDSEDVFLVIEFNGGSSYRNVQLTGQLPPKSYYLVGQNEFSTHYGFSAQIEEVINPIASGDGNDTYFLSFGGNDNEERIRNFFDIYGELGIDASSSTPWFYEEKIAYRKNPPTIEESQIWDNQEWSFISGTGTIADATPDYGNQDYIYKNNWSEIGLGDPNGNVSYQENIEIRVGQVSLSGDIEVHDLVVRSGATLVLEPGVVLSVSGDIVNEGTIIFESNDSSTAVLDAVQPNTRVVGDGFEIHRRIPVQNGIRAYRYLSSSVDTQNSAKPFVYDNWQEGGSSPIGFGTHITGTVGPLGNISSEGFDTTPTGNSSMYFWNNSLQNWSSIPNTNATNFSVGNAYAILIRGDRTSPLNTNDQTGPSTTLRTTGQIHVGDFGVTGLSTTNGHFNLVGNPYQSQVDLVELLQNNAQHVDNNYAYVWDPTIGSLGGYANVDLNMPSNTQSYPFGSASPATSDVNQYLQPQQAFFVQTTGGTPQITFKENTKNNSTGQTAVFSQEPPDYFVLDLSLLADDGRTYDGVRLVYGNGYNNGFDQLDATKFWNYTDNMCILSNNTYLSVEKRNTPSDNEETTLNLFGLTLNQYYIEGRFYADDPSFSIYLKDHYTGQTSEILPNVNFSYAFSFDAGIPETMATNRFSLQYGNTTLGVNDLNFGDGFSLYPNPNSNGNFNIKTPQLSGDVQVEILNLLGQQVYVQNLTVEGQQVDVKAANLSSGIYVVKLSQAGQSFSSKLIIE
jgi:hypothetical protein